MTNKIAIVEETEEEAEDGGMIIREAEDYFDKVYAVESKDLKFFFDDDEDVNDHLMYAYCLQGNVEYKIFLSNFNEQKSAKKSMLASNLDLVNFLVAKCQVHLKLAID